MINWNTPRGIVPLFECCVCHQDHLRDDLAKCQVCGHLACMDPRCTDGDYLETGANICNKCHNDDPHDVATFLAAELVKAQQIGAAKDKYIDSLRGGA